MDSGIIEMFEDIIEVQEVIHLIPRHEKHSYYFIYSGKFCEVYIERCTFAEYQLINILCLVEGMDNNKECTEDQLIFIANTYFR